MFIQSTQRNAFAAPTQQQAPAKPAQAQDQETPPADGFQFNADSVTKSALIGAVYGAVVGGGSGLLYNTTDLGSATAIHMTAILGGGALGAGVLSGAIDHQFEGPMSYAMGSLLGAGVTWGTSALGLMARPAFGAVTGAIAGAFYGGIGGMVFGQESAKAPILANS